MSNYVEVVRKDLGKESGCNGELLDLYTLLALTLGENVELRGVHDAWAIWKNKSMPEHRSLVPFEKLATNVQRLDSKYCEAIKTVSRRHSLWL